MSVLYTQEATRSKHTHSNKNNTCYNKNGTNMSIIIMTFINRIRVEDRRKI